MYVQVPNAIAAILSAVDQDTGRTLVNTYYFKSDTAPADPDKMQTMADSSSFNIGTLYVKTWQNSITPYWVTLVDLSPGADYYSVRSDGLFTTDRPGNPLPKATAMIWSRRSAWYRGRAGGDRMYLFPTFDWATQPDYPYFTTRYFNWVWAWLVSDAYDAAGLGWQPAIYSRHTAHISPVGLQGMPWVLGNRLGRRKQHGRR